MEGNRWRTGSGREGDREEERRWEGTHDALGGRGGKREVVRRSMDIRNTGREGGSRGKDMTRKF